MPDGVTYMQAYISAASSGLVVKDRRSVVLKILHLYASGLLMMWLIVDRMP